MSVLKGNLFCGCWCALCGLCICGVIAITSIYDNVTYNQIKLDQSNCFVNNFSYTDYNETKSTKLTFYATIYEINLTNNLIQYYENPKNYTLLISNKNQTKLSQVLNNTIYAYLYKNITCYTDNINMYLNNNDHKKPYLNIIVIILTILFFICCCGCFICMCANE